MGDKANWVNLYDDDGDLQARFNPQTFKLIIRQRRRDKEHDLGAYLVDENKLDTRQPRIPVLK